MLVPVGLMAHVGIPAAVMVAAHTTLIQTGVADAHRGRLFGSFFATMALSSRMGTPSPARLATWLAWFHCLRSTPSGTCAVAFSC